MVENNYIATSCGKQTGGPAPGIRKAKTIFFWPLFEENVPR